MAWIKLYPIMCIQYMQYIYIQYLYAHEIFKVGESVNFTAWEIVVGELVTGEVMLGNLPSNI